MNVSYDIAERLSLSTRGVNVLDSLGLMQGDIRQTIVVAGSPRSGTTWLAEVLSTLPDYLLVDEPLHLRWPAAKKAGFQDWRTYIAPRAEAPAPRAYLEKALSGRVSSDRQFHGENQLAQVKELLCGQKNVVKFVRANRMLHWMSNQFSTRGILLMLRHPCSVVASQLSYKDDSWRRTEPPDANHLRTGFGGWVPDRVFERFEHVLASVRSTAGRLAAIWCLDTYFPLYEQDLFPGFITTYERLLTREVDEVNRICEWLGEPVPQQTLNAFDAASHSASSDLATQNVHDQLSKWRDKLEQQQVDEILQVVEAFGLGFYTEALEPDYDRITALSKKAARN